MSRGVLAKAEDLAKAFGTTDEAAIALRILSEGAVQVSDKERELEYDTAYRDVAAAVAGRCVNPATRRPYTAAAVERALKSAGFAVDPRRPAKQQVVDAVKSLEGRLPLERARMRLRAVGPASAAAELSAAVTAGGATIEASDLALDGSTVALVLLAEPGAYRGLAAAVAGAGCRLEVVDVAATDDAGEGVVQAPPVEAAEAAPPPPATPVAVVPAHDDDDLTAGVAGLSVGDPPAAPPPPRAAGPRPALYPRGPIAGLPESVGARRDMFLALDGLQPGWTVELTPRAGAGEGGAVDAAFWSPGGGRYANFAAARRAALMASKGG